MFGYSVYGLTIGSDIDLPELYGHSNVLNADIQICLGKVGKPPPEVFSLGRYIDAKKEAVTVCWPDVGAFRISGGNTIIVEPAEGCQPSTLRLFLLGTTLAIALHQRGLAVFHASAASIEGMGVILVGKKGAGKSSLAAALHAIGHEFLSDDLAVLDASQPPYTLLPGFSFVKLWPDSAHQVFGDRQLDRLRPELEKIGARLDGAARDLPALRAVVFLDEGPEESLQPIAPQVAVVELMGHWYGARFGQELFTSLGPVDHLRHCSKVAQVARSFKFFRQNDISSLKSQAQYLSNALRQEISESD